MLAQTVKEFGLRICYKGIPIYDLETEYESESDLYSILDAENFLELTIYFEYSNRMFFIRLAVIKDICRHSVGINHVHGKQENKRVTHYGNGVHVNTMFRFIKKWTPILPQILKISTFQINVSDDTLDHHVALAKE